MSSNQPVQRNKGNGVVARIIFLDSGAASPFRQPRRLGPEDAGERGQKSPRTGWRLMSRPGTFTDEHGQSQSQ